MKRGVFFILSLNCLFSLSVEAHHGRKYLVMSSYDFPHEGSWYALFDMGISNHHHGGSFEMEPGILYGITNHWDVEFHSHSGLDDGTFHTEAIALESRIGMIGDFSDEHHNGDAEHQRLFGVTLLVEFEKSFLDHPDNFEGRLIIGSELDEISLDGNLIWHQEFDVDWTNEARFALGFKRNVSHVFGLGLEYDGSFKQIKASRLTPGVYLSVAGRLDLKFGSTIRINSDSEDNIIRLAFVYGLD